MGETRKQSEHVGDYLSQKLYRLYEYFYKAHGLTSIAEKYLDDYYSEAVVDLDNKLEVLLYEIAVETNS